MSRLYFSIVVAAITGPGWLAAALALTLTSMFMLSDKNAAQSVYYPLVNLAPYAMMMMMKFLLLLLLMPPYLCFCSFDCSCIKKNHPTMMHHRRSSVIHHASLPVTIMRLAAAAAATTTMSYPLVNSDTNDCDKGQSPVLFLIFQKGKQLQTVVSGMHGCTGAEDHHGTAADD
jgi:hypothetical protein